MRYILIAAFIAAFSVTAFPQSKGNDQISQQLRKRRLDKSFTLSFDAGGGTSRLMAVAENFDSRETDKAGLQAMNFAMGCFYPGNVLKASPDPIMLTFWVLTKRPRFASAHAVTVAADGAAIDLGEARYAAKAREDMEYLNLNVSRADLTKIGSSSRATVKIGVATFTFTPAQLKLIRDFLEVTAP
jgi:hypothetical protein